MAGDSPFIEKPSQPATREELVLILAERMVGMQREMALMRSKLDLMASEQSTQTAIAGLGGQIDTLSRAHETRLRVIEDWKTGISAQVKLAYAFSAFVAGIAALIGRYWRP